MMMRWRRRQDGFWNGSRTIRARSFKIVSSSSLCGACAIVRCASRATRWSKSVLLLNLLLLPFIHSPTKLNRNRRRHQRYLELTRTFSTTQPQTSMCRFSQAKTRSTPLFLVSLATSQSLMRSQINLATTMSTPPTIDEERVPLYEQDLDLGRDGVWGLSRNGLSPPVEEYVHHH